MQDYFSVHMGDEKIREITNLGLAHLGDGVYELLVRTWLCSSGKVTSKGLHKATVLHVSAAAQARAAERMLPHLTASEADIFRRGRNTKVNSVPKKADIAAYHMATGLECLFGHLYLAGERERINELFAIALPEEKPLYEGDTNAT